MSVMNWYSSPTMKRWVLDGTVYQGTSQNMFKFGGSWHVAQRAGPGGPDPGAFLDLSGNIEKSFSGCTLGYAAFSTPFVNNQPFVYNGYLYYVRAEDGYIYVCKSDTDWNETKIATVAVGGSTYYYQIGFDFDPGNKKLYYIYLVRTAADTADLLVRATDLDAETDAAIGTDNDQSWASLHGFGFNPDGYVYYSASPTGNTCYMQKMQVSDGATTAVQSIVGYIWRGGARGFFSSRGVATKVLYLYSGADDFHWTIQTTPSVDAGQIAVLDNSSDLFSIAVCIEGATTVQLMTIEQGANTVATVGMVDIGTALADLGDGCFVTDPAASVIRPSRPFLFREGISQNTEWIMCDLGLVEVI